MRNIKPREMQFMVGGLVVGLVFGALAGAAGLFGTAGDSGGGGGENIEVDTTKFYLVDLSTAQQWLEQTNPDGAGDIGAQLTDIEGLTQSGGALDLGQYYTDKRDSFDTVLLSIQDTLLKEEGADTAEGLTTCIGLDSDPYSLSGPGVYVYIGVPSSYTDEIPSDWTQLAGPKEQNMLWTTACYEGSTDASTNVSETATETPSDN